MTRTLRLGLILGTFLVANAASADDPAPGARGREEEARVHFTAGVNLVRDPARPRYDEAYIEFKKAYALAGSAKILGNIGLCAMKLERDAEAIDAYTRYLAEVPDLAPDERTQVERDLATLKTTLATVTVEPRPGNATIIDTRIAAQGDSMTNTYGPISGRTALKIRRGHHVMRARFDGGREVSWEADINGGESYVFELPAAPRAPLTTTEPTPTMDVPTERPVPTSVFVAGGITVALGLGSLVTGIVALDRQSAFEDQNTGADPAAARDVRSTGQTFNTVSDGLLIGAIVGAAVTAYLYLTRPPRPVQQAVWRSSR